MQIADTVHEPLHGFIRICTEKKEKFFPHCFKESIYPIQW